MFEGAQGPRRERRGIETIFSYVGSAEECFTDDDCGADETCVITRDREGDDHATDMGAGLSGASLALPHGTPVSRRT